MSPRSARIGVAIALTAVLLGGIVTVVRSAAGVGRTTVVGYFANSTGLYNGDSVVILGVPVGKIEKIEPEPDRVRITFWLNDKYKVPADVKAAILSPSLVTPRSIQLTPAYTGGPALADHAVIPQQRTAVPVEYDDFRQQLEKLTQVLQPTAPGGTSTLGAFINTAADNLRGQGPDIRKTVIELSQAISALGDHSNDLFSTVKNLSILVSALHDSSDLLQQLNQNLAEVTGLLANDPNEVANAVRNLNDVVGDVRGFVAENRDALGTTSDKLASVTQAVTDSLGDVKQLLHTAPTAFQNFLNIYQPAQGTLTGALAFNNFANTIQFLCGAVEAASRLGAKESAKLCVQYLAPIIKNRQVNFPPLGENLFVGAAARPNELTYSEDWLRPDYVPPHPDSPPTGDAPAPPAAGATPAEAPPPAADAPPPAQAAPTNPAEGLRGMMMPPGGGQ
ncbi:MULTISPECIES: virulence factor Mce family protein [Mycobacteriaceae]|jgi:phospholipid/cholesterol/gamma-HCH transport system substrate-binding protein|nr:MULTISPECIES: virulence factor Mce family protein [Mycobacteriaceae]MBZ4508463.1 virulence factor Mce family protein [Mycobacterium avium subsp. hominissuis]MBZ4515385.1 virulence factor Mce family protein [Mycobacterium avium subsp. hominissuis]MBZ4527980.1 virulence factor Mce family protein [Mycobacterium avium subsp. hominissuis]MBZ4554529.1 virulence factor Mce family protein [Mycobacterium avium subsp. hominissuis]MBZ4563511.1 virulence factor Mce family protein [Mycobacterium avium s